MLEILAITFLAFTRSPSSLEYVPSYDSHIYLVSLLILLCTFRRRPVLGIPTFRLSSLK
jgi:hypothetical protein